MSEASGLDSALPPNAWPRTSSLCGSLSSTPGLLDPNLHFTRMPPGGFLCALGHYLKTL